MLSSFLKSGLSSLESMSLISTMQKDQNSKAPSKQSQQFPVQKIVEETLIAISSLLSQKVGEQFNKDQIKQLTSQVLTSKHLEDSLVELKEKYNELVNKSATLYQQARKISHSLSQFITNINLFLESQQLLVPLNQIQKAVGELNADRVEKQFNYLIKIFTNNFQEIIDKNVSQAEKNFNEEIKIIKNLNKNLENEILSIKSNKNNDQSKYLQQALRATNLNDKINKLTAEREEQEKEIKQLNKKIQEKITLVTQQQAQIKRLKLKQSELVEKIRQSQVKSLRVEKQVKERSSEAETLNSAIQTLKRGHEQLLEQIKSEYQKKEMQHENLRKKIYNQKAVLQEKLDGCNQRIGTLQFQLQKKINENNELLIQIDKLRDANQTEIDFEKVQTQNSVSELRKQEVQRPKQQPQSKHKMTLSQIKSKIANLEAQNKQIQQILKKERDLNVNREVLKGLFLSYDDQSKQWGVRRNIKYQIYSLLGLQQKIPKPEQTKSKWFGLF